MPTALGRPLGSKRRSPSARALKPDSIQAAASVIPRIRSGTPRCLSIFRSSWAFLTASSFLSFVTLFRHIWTALEAKISSNVGNIGPTKGRASGDNVVSSDVVFVLFAVPAHVSDGSDAGSNKSAVTHRTRLRTEQVAFISKPQHFNVISRL